MAFPCPRAAGAARRRGRCRDRRRDDAPGRRLPPAAGRNRPDRSRPRARPSGRHRAGYRLSRSRRGRAYSRPCRSPGVGADGRSRGRPVRRPTAHGRCRSARRSRARSSSFGNSLADRISARGEPGRPRQRLDGRRRRAAVRSPALSGRRGVRALIRARGCVCVAPRDGVLQRRIGAHRRQADSARPGLPSAATLLRAARRLPRVQRGKCSQRGDRAGRIARQGCSRRCDGGGGRRPFRNALRPFDARSRGAGDRDRQSAVGRRPRANPGRASPRRCDRGRAAAAARRAPCVVSPHPRSFGRGAVVRRLARGYGAGVRARRVARRRDADRGRGAGRRRLWRGAHRT